MFKKFLIFAVLVLACIDASAQTNKVAREFLQSANTHLRANEYEAAAADYKKVIELEPNNADALFYLIASLNSINPYSDPTEYWDRIIEVAPHYKLIYIVYMQRANYRARIGKFDESISDVNKALEFTPDDGSLYHLRGYSYIMKGNLEAAHADYNKSVELKTRLQNPLLTRGYLLRMRRDLAGAVADYTMAIDWNPNDSIAYVDRGTVYVMMGQIDQGLADIRKGMQLDQVSVAERAIEGFGCPFCSLNVYVKGHPMDARVYEARGILRILQKQESDARSEFDRSLSIAPELKPEIERVKKEILSWN